MATRTTPPGQGRGMAKRILIAEDDPDNRFIVVKVLTLAGYETLEAADGRSALALARRERPDLIMMDLSMPGMDGWEASRRLKADPRTADIPIIALTAFALRGDEERARDAGCDGYLSKPCRSGTIRDAVARFLVGR
jgi:two-component system cell cycle response regulator DivK